MSFVAGNAPVAFSNMTSATGTSAQVWQMSATGVTAGQAAGNFYVGNTIPANLLNGRKFTVLYGGWLKSHGASQTVTLGLQVFPYTNGTIANSGTSTVATSTASGNLIAGTFYNFSFAQDFFGESNSAVLSCEFNPTVVIAGTNVAYTGANATIAVTNFATASQTEPITGINLSTNYPLAAWAPTFTNSVSDTTMTLALTTCELIIQ